MMDIGDHISFSGYIWVYWDISQQFEHVYSKLLYNSYGLEFNPIHSFSTVSWK